MHQLSGYTLQQQIHHSHYSVVYRGRQNSDGQPVVVKFLTQAYSVVYANSKLRQEYDIARRFDSPYIVKPHELASYQDTFALVLEDFGGVALRTLLRGEPLPIKTFLNIALQIVDALALIHDQSIIHKDINPRNILINPDTYAVKITDFGIASVLAYETSDVNPTQAMEGTLSYISPEQTGRMKRPVDYRTDFYSLGVVCYELLTGRLPFYGQDELEIIHQHIAKMPQPLLELRSAMPPVLAELVMKLLAKSADERYQSAFGLKMDLQQCAQAYEETGQIDPFPLGRYDRSDKFQLPQKLYGRTAEVAQLMHTFDTIARGSSALLTVTGVAGVGKSALIQEIHKPLLTTKGYVISGKFDQYKLGLPYSALVQAIKDFIQQVLRNTSDQVAYWRKRLQKTVGVNGQVLVDVIPDLELLIGPQDSVITLDATEAQHRFNALFTDFITALADQDHPLVLFIDDVHWADRATLKLLEVLLTSPAIGYLMVIVAYRDNELEPLHPLNHLLKELKAQYRLMPHIHVDVLSEHDQQQLIADTLHTSFAAVESLAQLVASRTGGNPFFVAELLKTLYQKKLLYFDQLGGLWQWDLAGIKQLGITQNIVELMQSKIQELSEESQEALRLAACIGNTFNLHVLALVSAQSPREAALALRTPIQVGLIVPVGDTDKLLKFLYTEADDALFILLTFNFRFLHDRIQQAAYQLIPDSVKEHVHLRIGRYLKAQLSDQEFEERLFDITNHFNIGIELLTDDLERYQLGDLNALAARKAKSSTAYTEALAYFIRAIDLLPSFSWQTNYAATFNLYRDTAETEYLKGDVVAARERCEWLLSQAKNTLHKAQIYEIVLLSYTAQKEFSKGIDVALKALHLLGVDLPRHPNLGHIGYNLVKTRLTIGLHSPKKLATLPTMTDQHQRTAIRLLVLTAPLAYQSEPDLLPILVFVMVRLSVLHGNTPLSSYAYLLYGMAMNGVLGNLKAGLAYTQTGLDIMQRFNAQELRAKNEGMYNFFLRHWKEPLRNTVAPMLDLAQAGEEAGDVEYQAYNYFFYCQARFSLGDNLELLEQEFELYHDALIRLKQDVQAHVMSILFQTVLNLRGHAADPLQLVGSRFDTTKAAEALFDSAVFYKYYYQAVLAFLLRQPELAYNNMRQARKVVAGVMSMNVVPVFYWYDALIMLALYPTLPSHRKLLCWARIKRSLKKLHEWAQYAPDNQRHRVALLEAEIARVQGAHAAAIELFSKAVVLCRDSGYTQDAALANELAGEYYLQLANAELARTYILEAYRMYARWGAVTKIAQLEVAYAFLRRNKRNIDEYDTLHLSNHDVSTTVSLDFTSVLKASQSISSEIQLDKLLNKLMASVIENAGAQRGFLLIYEHDHWLIEAAGFLDPNDHLRDLEFPMQAEVAQLVPLSMIEFVAHSRNHVLMNDALTSADFAHDPYIQHHRPRSMLCTPLIKQGELMGILYLENNLLAEVFTLESLEVVNLLASQAAISLDNARLYANLEHLVSERTAALSQANANLSQLNQQLTSELQLARTIQQSLLPPLSPEWPALHVVCDTTPVRAVGGDLYTYYEFNPQKKPERYAIVVGDVSGKGMPAALLMGVSLASFRGLVSQGLSPTKILSQLDMEMLPYTRTTRQNCALVYCDIKLESGIYQYQIANAGCMPPLLRYADGTLQWLEVGGFPLGTGLGLEYQQLSGILNPGDMLLLTTDGLVEAMNEQREMFGFERFEAYVASGPAEPLAMLKHLKQAATEFVGAVEAHDDLTIVIIQPPKM